MAVQPTNTQRPDGAAATAPAIELRGINKHFGPVHANRDIDLKVARGGNTLSIVRGGAALVCEFPLSVKFLDRVYVELPALFDKAKAHARRKKAGNSGS